LEILPARSSRHVSKNDYVKVLVGTISWMDLTTKVLQTRTSFCEPKRLSTLAITSYDGRITTGDDGALLIVYENVNGIENIPRIDSIKKDMIKNSLPDYCLEDARRLNFQYVKCDQFEWGLKFKGLEFYNMSGFTIKFIDDGKQLCHMQLWAAGKGTNCGVHNHLTNTFCEVHTCLVNGTGNGGMQFLDNSKQEYDPKTTLDSEFKKLAVPSFHEHGPLWDIGEQGQPVARSNGTIVYPWHKWQSGTDHSSHQSFDIWMAFEFDKEFSKIPKLY